MTVRHLSSGYGIPICICQIKKDEKSISDDSHESLSLSVMKECLVDVM